MRVEIDPETFAAFIYKNDKPIPFMVLSDREKQEVLLQIDMLKKHKNEQFIKDMENCPF